MEITLNIPRNDYSQPTEPRPDVIQYIINAFLDNNNHCTGIFHPVNDGYARTRHIYIEINEGYKTPVYRFVSCPEKSHTRSRFVRFYGCEMRAAMKGLIQAGWHILEVYEYCTWRGYICHEKPFYDYCGHGSREIRAEQFTDFID